MPSTTAPQHEPKKKHELERALYDERQAVAAGSLKEDNPLDQSKGFQELCEACRRGDMKQAQEKIIEGVNVNGRDAYDYTPLILASLCGHYSLVQLLLDSNALCERDTFQGERCLYNALNDKIRTLLLSYDYSKSRDPLQPLASHVTSLLHRDVPDTSDIGVISEDKTFRLHKFILSARSPYFEKKLAAAPDTSSWRIPPSIPSESLQAAINGLYFSEASNSINVSSSEEGQIIVEGINRLAHQLDIEAVLDIILEQDRRQQRQKRSAEVSRGRDQLQNWFGKNVIAQRLEVRRDKVDDVKWDRQNALFADVLLCAEDDEDDDEAEEEDAEHAQSTDQSTIPIGHFLQPDATTSTPPNNNNKNDHKSRTSTLFPVHRAMLLRADYFNAMFSSSFAEAQQSEHLPIVRIDCAPEVLEIILRYLYTETVTFGLDVAIDVLFTADQLLLEPLKTKAATVISGLGSGDRGAAIAKGEDRLNNSKPKLTAKRDDDPLHIPTVMRAAWTTRTPRLEEFSARYIADRLEDYIDDPEFRELVHESAARISQRQETDTVELIDDIRYYLSERFKMRMEDAGLEDMLDEEEAKVREISAAEAADAADGAEKELGRVVDRDETQIDAAARHDALVDDGGAQIIKTLEGDDTAGDELAQDAHNYRVLMSKIDTLLDELRLDA